MNMKIIRNRQIQDYLEENECLAAIIDGRDYYYIPTKQLSLLLEKYYIKYTCIPNK